MEVLLIFNACPGKAVGVNAFVVILARLCYSYTTGTQKTNLTSYQLLEMVTEVIPIHLLDQVCVRLPSYPLLPLQNRCVCLT